MKKLFCGLMLMLGLTGCVTEATVTVPAVEEADVVTYQAPPAPVVEVVPAAPSHRHVWCEGYWRWTGVRYTWVSGRWDYRPGYRYYRGGWTHTAGRWYYRPARWRR